MVNMRISKIHVKNFKSLKNTSLNGLGKMVVLVGKNGSGKSNILDALYLFFSEFNLIEPSSVGPTAEFDTHMWHNLETKNPIEIILSIQFDPEECEEIFPTEALNIIKKRFPESYDQVTFCRKIVDVKTDWKTEYVKWADVVLVKNNKLVAPEEFCKSLIAPPTEITVTPPFPESTAAKMIGKITSSLQERIKGRFRLARVTRDSPERSSNIIARAPVIDPETCETLRLLGQSRKHEDIKRWTDVEKTFEASSSMRLEVREGEIFARKNSLCLPMHLVGGGDQETLILKHFLMHEGLIMAIEEPEMHLHPRVVMRFSKIMKEVSATSQIFLVTHSPIILDEVDVQSVWITRMEGKETKSIGLHNAEEMRQVLMELDIPFSKLLFTEKILLVKGPTEKVMLPILAKNMGIDPDSFSVIPVNSKPQRLDGWFAFFRRSQSKDYHLRAWSEFSKKTDIPLFLLLYKTAKDEVEMLIREGSLQPRSCAILPKAIENYVPVEILASVLNENYGLQLSIKDIAAERPRVSETKRILNTWQKIHPGWKTFVAEKTAEKMPREKIPNEIKMLFESMMKVTQDNELSKITTS